MQPNLWIISICIYIKGANQQFFLVNAANYWDLQEGKITIMKQPEVLLRKTLGKTKSFFYTTFKNLKSFYLAGGYYHKLPNNTPPFVNPFNNFYNCSHKSIRELDDSYICFSEQQQENRSTTLSLSPKVQTMIMGDEEYSQTHSNTERENSMVVVKNSKKERGGGKGKKKEELCCCNGGGGTHYNLAQKMKELEMLDLDMEEKGNNDAVDHLQDIEEVLHHYARLKCPVYLELLDKFFMDMYSEFLLPVSQPSLTSIRSLRLGPLKL